MSRSLFLAFEPALWEALNDMADGMRYLRAPDDIDPPTGARVPRKWLPCSAPRCRNVDVVSLACVSFVCSECASPCESIDCGLMRFEHYSHDDEERHPCEPRVEAMSRAEVQAELDRRGIDVKPALAKVLAAAEKHGLLSPTAPAAPSICACCGNEPKGAPMVRGPGGALFCQPCTEDTHRHTAPAARTGGR